MQDNGNHFLISLTLLAFGKTVDLIAEVQPVLAHYQVPPGIMQLFMIIAYCGTGMAGSIAALNYFEIKWNPFKKNKSKTKKHD